MHLMISKGSEHQTSFFAHEVFEYFLPAQKVFRLAGERGEGQNWAVREGSNESKKYEVILLHRTRYCFSKLTAVTVSGVSHISHAT
jgi:hypothetical protein